jgi:glycine/D-amino acid oxidase-like deaminating enzyme
MQRADVLIAGGGVVGSAAAYFLKVRLGFSGTVVVAEPDPSYAFAASTRSAASIRQQFSTPLNIALSAFGMEFLRTLGPAVGLKESTYLCLASVDGAAALRRNTEVQRGCGVAARLHDSAGLKARYPWMNVSDVAAGATTDDGEGWFDGYALLRALRQANERAGITYLRDEVAKVRMGGVQAAVGVRSVEGVRLGGGESIECRWLVIAAGVHSRGLAAQAGIDLPVVARKRSVFVFSCERPPENCPLIVDPSGFWCRPEGDRFICGVVPRDDVDVALDDFEVDHPQFESQAWPALAHRVPAFEAVRVTGCWAGHYDYNIFDQNAFLGPCDGVPNLILASGFSGHGLQHAPGVGRALAEFISFGDYRSIDVKPFSHARYLRGRPIREQIVI